MDALHGNPLAIDLVLARLRERFGDDVLAVEYWDHDLCAVRVAREGAPERVLLISTCDRPEGEYDVSLEGPPARGASRPPGADGRYERIDFETLAAVVAEQLALEPRFTLRRATERDVPLILSFIRELARHERLEHEVTATEEGLRESLFGATPGAEVLLAFAGDEPAGFALFFHNYSTFLGRRGIYLEDLYVRPAWRARGLGRRLLATLARLTRERGGGRLEWWVLDWNESAVRFYRSLGARAMDEWTVYRLSDGALDSLAAEGGGPR
ncbi:MAG TPA: GNAT family N-acetyltransferase [Gemmatimonadaceae bacterium]|nr:GNAT family N-acetyltransferase [Gemmatimonadaceae bacterium]